jgi:hypothetical protein
LTPYFIHSLTAYTLSTTQGWKKKDDALMLAIQYKHGLPSSWTDPLMEYFTEHWDTKPPKLVFKRIELLYNSDVFDEMTDEYLDLLTDEDRARYCPGFGTAQMLTNKDNWGRTDTDFDYRNRKQGGEECSGEGEGKEIE